jgi:acyl-coenzyme A thioesterase PaaI-like protein
MAAMAEHGTDLDVEAVAALAQSARGLVDAVVRSQVDADELRAVRAELDALTERLRASQLPASVGAAYGWEAGRRHWGNAVIGLRNPIAPPLDILREGGRVSAGFTLGAAYEGPPTFVHGGVSALILDQMLGEAAASSGRPGMTGTLSIRYRHPTPLGPLRAEAEVVRTEGVKTYAEGRVLVAQPDGTWRASVEAEGVFILPRWAREKLAERGLANESGAAFFE